MLRKLSLIAFMLILSISLSLAQVAPAPSLMNFQGRLAQPNGNPVPDGTYSIVFSIYDAPTGGNQKWNQVFLSVAVRNGAFAVPLGTTLSAQGAVSPSGTLDEGIFVGDRWLQIQISGSSNPQFPRQQIVPVALAFKANTVPDGAIGSTQLADNAVLSAKLKDLAVTAAKLADLAVQTAKLADGAVSNSKLADAAVTTAKLADAAITTIKIADAAINNAKLADNAVITAKLADGSVITSKLADSAITTAKIAPLSVTNAAIVSVDYSKITNVPAVPSAIPPGTVVAYAGSTVPNGWLLCDGSAVNRTTYSALFSVISIAHGLGDGVVTFNLPDYRGLFLRMVDGNAGRDPDKSDRTAMAFGGNTGNAIGAVQFDAARRPNNPFTTDNPGNHTHANGSYDRVLQHTGRDTTQGVDNGDPSGSEPDLLRSASMTGAGAHTHTIIGGGDNETRPKNAYVYYIIKY